MLVTEDAVAYLEDKAPRHVLNQWTYHARMYNAARYVCTQPDMELIQLVSFGCGIDAITGDEMRSILEEGGKLYTQLKIDDISNLGAVKIRIRSLMAAIEARKHSGAHHRLFIGTTGADAVVTASSPPARESVGATPF